MPSALGLLLYGLIVVAIILVTDAAIGFIRSARGIDDEIVRRRLLNKGADKDDRRTTLEFLKPGVAVDLTWHRFIPFNNRLTVLLRQSGIALSKDRAIVISCVATLLAFVPSLFVLPPKYLPFTLLFALVAGPAAVIGFLSQARTKRRLKFEEQLPDAIDLIVRSLRVGHPLSGAISVVGREMPDPLGLEFQIASSEILYGLDVPAAIAGVADRVGSADLGYLTVAVQIQQESGGNLAESLAKLSNIIRERFRMFRKVKAITAEGRFSAWLLSLFPFGIGIVIEFVHPGYFTQVEDYPYFPYLVGATVLMLIVNLIAMRILTTIKV
jgi:tight adherence protein B